MANTTAADRSIIRDFVNAVKEIDPDIIAGYNSDFFDLPYLIDRAKLIGESLKGTGRNNKEMYMLLSVCVFPDGPRRTFPNYVLPKS